MKESSSLDFILILLSVCLILYISVPTTDIYSLHIFIQLPSLHFPPIAMLQSASALVMRRCGSSTSPLPSWLPSATSSSLLQFAGMATNTTSSGNESSGNKTPEQLRMDAAARRRKEAEDRQHMQATKAFYDRKQKRRETAPAAPSTTAPFAAASPIAPAAPHTPAVPPTPRQTPPNKPAQTEPKVVTPTPQATPIPDVTSVPVKPVVKPVVAAPSTSAADTSTVSPSAATTPGDVSAFPSPTPVASAPANSIPTQTAPVSPKSTSSTDSGGSGTGGKLPPPSPAEPAKPEPKKKSVLSRLLLLAIGGSGAVLALLKLSDNIRDYCDVHLPVQMAQLRSLLPKDFLPPPSRRSHVGRAALSVGLLETPKEDLENARKSVATAAKQAPKQLSTIANEVEQKVDRTLADADKRVNGALKDAASHIDAMNKKVEQTVTDVRKEIVSTTKDIQHNVIPVVEAVLGKEQLKQARVELEKDRKVRGNVGQSSTGNVELDALLLQIANAEDELENFSASKQQTLWNEVAEAERVVKQRYIARLNSIESSQLHIVSTASIRQDRALVHRHERLTDPARLEFENRLRWEEENKWRKKLYDTLETQNDVLSDVADKAILNMEEKLQFHYATEIARLDRALADTEKDTVEPLKSALEDHRHRQLRSAQAHRLSAALLELQTLVEQDHASLSSPWKVIRDISKEDYTLRQAIAAVDDATVEGGIFPLRELKQVFAQELAPALKVATFTPEATSSGQASVLSQVLARLFSAATINESGAVVLTPPPFSATQAARAAAPTLRAARREEEASHQAADYAHYVNACTFLASNAPELALRELEVLHPSRISEQLHAFIRELRKAVQVHNAVAVVKMRVLAINDAPRK
jgi:hypothetical protein